jgi:hypothetical protein
MTEAPKPNPQSGDGKKGPVVIRGDKRHKKRKVLDAHDYGHKSWPIHIRPRR